MLRKGACCPEVSEEIESVHLAYIRSCSKSIFQGFYTVTGTMLRCSKDGNYAFKMQVPQALKPKDKP